MMKEEKPFFSIIITLFNKEAFIEQTLQTVMHQNFKNYEVLIINDGSTDKSVEIATRYKSNNIQIIHQNNSGVAAARNHGIKLAKANYITFLDADDYWYPNFLQTFYELILKFPNQNIFSAAIEIQTSLNTIPAQYSIDNIIANKVYNLNYFKASKKFSLIFTSCAVFKKNIFLEIGKFDTNLHKGEDTDLWIRMGLNYPIIFKNTILTRYVLDPNSLSRNKKITQLNYYKYSEFEFKNYDLKYFLDLNRYSEAIGHKSEKNYSNFKLIKKDISLSNLSFKKRILLKTPRLILLFFIQIQPILIKLKLRNTVYK